MGPTAVGGMIQVLYAKIDRHATNTLPHMPGLIPLLFFVSLFCHAHKFAEAISNGDEYLVSTLISKGSDVNEYDNESESTPLIDAIRSGNLKILLLLLDAGANPNQFLWHPQGKGTALIIEHPLSFASTLSQIVLLLTYGANPDIDNSWEYNDASSYNRYLHLLIYHIWDFEAELKKPQSIEQLNTIIFTLPVLRIQSYLTILLTGYEIVDLCSKDKKFLKDAFINF